MRRLFVIFLCWIARGILSLRYQVKIIGLEKIKRKHMNRNMGVLFLPNHPAHIDPLLVILHFWPKFKLHPIVVEYVYRQTFIHSLMKMIGAVPIPNLESSLNELKLKNAEEVIHKVEEGLKKKHNYLLYPSGRLKHTGKEMLGGASAAHTILQHCPGTNVVLIRTTGLWGSSFSRAYEGKSPDIKTTAMMNLKWMLRDLFFFMPRRKVTIEIELFTDQLPVKRSRLEFNKFLEKWYNQYKVNDKIYETEPISKVSYSLYKDVYLKEFSAQKIKTAPSTPRQFSSKIEEEIVNFLLSLHPDSDITLNTHLADELGMDSLDMAELINFLSVQYDIADAPTESLQTVSDIVDIASGKAKPQKKEEPKKKFVWPEEKKRLAPELPIGKTIIEAFLRRCDRMGDSVACADDITGPVSYKRLKLAALALSKKIKKMPGETIAVLLPASIGAYLVILAIELAGNVPVMLNWTLGPRFLNHMMKASKAKKVISSWKFLERLSNVEFGKMTEDIVYLEDIRKGIGKMDKISALLLSYAKAKRIMRKLSLMKKKETDTAVILFTSGTEAVPKGVPLSHKNILSNQRAAMQCANLGAKDVMYGILPPFHSFGFSVAGLLPILSGIRVAYYPDPTDSRALAEGIERWKVSIFCSAPSFLKNLLRAAKPNQLKTMRLFVTGAEKTPRELYEQVAALNGDAKLIEGYGITECSPIISLNRPNRTPCGVGQLLIGLEFCTIHPESHEALSEGEEGEICVRGDSIFSGYLDENKNPFVMINGEPWYATGDLGYMDEKGNIILSGRLKRFAKIGGEMISLISVEEVLSDYLKRKLPEDDNPHLAVCAKEVEGDKSTLILFTTDPLERNEVNQALRDAGFSRLVKIAEVRQIDAIPIMGSGKIDYRFLQSMIEG